LEPFETDCPSIGTDQEDKTENKIDVEINGKEWVKRSINKHFIKIGPKGVYDFIRKGQPQTKDGRDKK
jgi:hypothetical protein